MTERHPIVPNSAESMKQIVYANIYLQLLDRLTNHDSETVELLMGLGDTISEWPDMEPLDSDIYRLALGKEVKENEENDNN